MRKGRSPVISCMALNTPWLGLYAMCQIYVALVATPRSYSWSANVCGRKEWLLYPPGEEELLRSRLGSLPFDITSQELEDRRMFPNARRACRPIHVIQGPGEVIFVPR